MPRGDRTTTENHRPRRRALTRRAVGLTSLAAGATAAAVAGGLATTGAEHGGIPAASLAAASGQSSEGTSTSGPSTPLAAPAKLTDEQLTEAQAAREATVVSRSDTRAKADPAKESTLEVRPGRAETRTESLADEDPRAIGRALLSEYGFGADQWGCLDSLWTKESGWRVNADNPVSSAYGIPQSLPGSKMASEGADWATNPVTQIRWGLGYIKSRYGTPCAAWGHSQARNWY